MNGSLAGTGQLIFNFSLMSSFSLIMACDPGHLTQDIVFSFKSNHLELNFKRSIDLKENIK